MRSPTRTTSGIRLAAGAAGMALVAGLASAPGTATGAGTVAPGPSSAATSGVSCSDVLGGGSSRAADFAAASRAAGVPLPVLKAVSYLQSRWDDHDGAVSTSGGFGPLHLTDVDVDLVDGRGFGPDRLPLQSMQTAQRAAELTGLSVRRLKDEPAANICGGAAVLAADQGAAGAPTGTDTSFADWTPAVATYSAAHDATGEARFVRQVWSVLRDGARRTTIDGQRVSLKARPQARPAAVTTARTSSEEPVDCPSFLGCEWIPAPYEQYGDTPYAYGNHDLADRPRDLSIDYIIVHDTEVDYETTLRLVTDPTYVSWQYTLRSADGHVAQHVKPEDVAWHAGNWWMNMHSIGLEHEGVAADGAAWYTEAMYRTSAALVKHLTRKYDIPRDRAHIIGHDQIPGPAPANVPRMHWDPGPFWDWEHYMKLIGAPIGGKDKGQLARKPIRVGDVVTVKPGFDDNVQPTVGCDEAGVPCEEQGSNFVYLHQAADADSPLVRDEGLRPGATESTTQVSDIGARAAAGQELVVAQTDGRWLGVWWLGRLAWLENPKGDATVVRARGPRARKVVPRPGLDEVPVYGRAYPEESAYPEQIPYQTIAPLQYTIRAGQAYALADATVATDYYYAKVYDDSLPLNRTVVSGEDRYYQAWFGHRMAYVRAADVRLVRH
ncbi:MAG: N-acetylmuramoyl-L-alanine amidase [Actinomycetota bacterium]|nr:N-acetylmuramoyl-L-alanine amidase [Actinomycetota bacterium]